MKIKSRFLNMAEAAGGKKEIPVLRHVHVGPLEADRYIVEAANGALMVSVVARTADGLPITEANDALLDRDNIKSILALSGGGVIDLTTEEDAAGDATFRDTQADMADGSIVGIHASNDAFPNFEAIRDREAIRPRLALSCNLVLLSRAAKLINRLCDAETANVEFPLDDSNAPLRLMAENEDGSQITVLLNPVREFAPSAAERFAAFANALLALMDSAHAEVGLGDAEWRSQMADRLQSMAAKCKGAPRARRADEGLGAAQMEFAEVAEMCADLRAALAAKKSKDAADDEDDPTPDMMDGADEDEQEDET